MMTIRLEIGARAALDRFIRSKIYRLRRGRRGSHRLE